MTNVNENKLAEFCYQCAVDYINDNLKDWQIKKLNEINFDYWQYISLCLQDKRITIQDIERKMLAYKVPQQND